MKVGFSPKRKSLVKVFYVQNGIITGGFYEPAQFLLFRPVKKLRSVREELDRPVGGGGGGGGIDSTFVVLNIVWFSVEIGEWISSRKTRFENQGVHETFIHFTTMID